MLDYASFPDQRQALIKDQLQQTGQVVCAKLAKQLNVSEHTIRRDLQELSSQGVCKKVYGGAVVNAKNEGSLVQRLDLNDDRKQILAKACIPYFKEKAFIFIDSGSTNLAIAKMIPKNLVLTVVTHTPSIAVALQSHEYCDVVLLGGKISKQQSAAIGTSSLKQLQTMHFDLAILGACAIDAQVGISAFDIEDAQFKKAIVEQSNNVLIAVTEEKLSSIARHKVTDLDSVSVLITEEKVKEEKLVEIRKGELQLVLAS